MGALCSRCRRPSAAEDGENKEIELSSFVHIDPALCGKDVRVNNDVVSGTGCAVANCALHQTRSYFEVTIKTSGTVYIGLTAIPKTALDVPMKDREQTWFLDCSSHPAGVVIGVSLDLSLVRPALVFTANGATLPQPTRQTVRGDVYPVIFVAEGAVVQCNFGTGALAHLPSGFEGLMCSIDLL